MTVKLDLGALGPIALLLVGEAPRREQGPTRYHSIHKFYFYEIFVVCRDKLADALNNGTECVTSRSILLTETNTCNDVQCPGENSLVNSSFITSSCSYQVLSRVGITSCLTQNSETMKIEDRQTAVEPFVVIRLRTVGRVVRNCQIGRDPPGTALAVKLEPNLLKRELESVDLVQLIGVAGCLEGIPLLRRERFLEQSTLTMARVMTNEIKLISKLSTVTEDILFTTLFMPLSVTLPTVPNKQLLLS